MPNAPGLARDAGSIIIGMPVSEQRQDVLCTVCRPTCQQATPCQVERTAMMDGDETSISSQGASLCSAERYK
jgi:hypothetical protein